MVKNEQSDWLEPAVLYVQEWLRHQMRVSEQPGCSIAIGYLGRVVLDASFGSASLRSGERLTPEHRFRVASHSKAFTAAAVMKLREEGAVRLDDPVGRYVSGLHPQLAARTIAQLLSNSSGISQDGLESDYWSDRCSFPDASRLRVEFEFPPTIEACSRLKYSNQGFALAGLAIEAIVSEPYSKWIAREIIEPSGLKHTTPDITPEAKATLAHGHSDKTLLGRRLIYPGDQFTGALAAAAGFVSTAADLCRFFGQLSPIAETSLLSAESRREMVHASWKDPFSSVERWYGLGTMSGKRKEWEWFGHSGGFQGYVTRTAVVPDQGLAISVLTNSSDGRAQEWLDAVLNILQRFRTNPGPPLTSSEWCGRWWSVWGAMDLVRLGNKVLLASPDLPDPFDKVPELSPTGPDEALITNAGAYHHHGEKVTLHRDPNRRVCAVQVAGDRWIPEAELAQELCERYR